MEQNSQVLDVRAEEAKKKREVTLTYEPALSQYVVHTKYFTRASGKISLDTIFKYVKENQDQERAYWAADDFRNRMRKSLRLGRDNSPQTR